MSKLPKGSIGHWNLGTFKARLRRHVPEQLAAAGSVSAINSAVENRLVTVASNTSELDAEAGLTFDGSTLKTISGTHVSSSGDVYVLGSISGSNNLAIGGNLHVSGALSKAYTSGGGHVSSSGDVYALGSISGSNNLAIGGNLHISGALSRAYTSGGGHVSSSGDVYALGSISGSNNLAIGGNIHASGTITCDTLNVNEINSTTKTVNTLEIVDKVILAASGAYPNNSTGAGLQIGGHSTGSAGTDIAATFFYNNSKNSMDLSTTLSSSGDLYVLGTISGSNNLAVGGNVEISGALNLGVSAGSSTHRLSLPNDSTSNNGKGVAYAWSTYSSKRYKENIQPIPRSLSLLNNLTGVTYNWKDTGKKDVGFIAEDVGAYIPEVVSYEENGVDATGMDYSRLTSVLVEAVKELDKKVEDQKIIITQLTEKIETLKDK